MQRHCVLVGQPDIPATRLIGWDAWAQLQAGPVQRSSVAKAKRRLCWGLPKVKLANRSILETSLRSSRASSHSATMYDSSRSFVYRLLVFCDLRQLCGCFEVKTANRSGWIYCLIAQTGWSNPKGSRLARLGLFSDLEPFALVEFAQK